MLARLSLQVSALFAVIKSQCSCAAPLRARRGHLQVAAAKKDKKGKLMWEALREAVDEEMEKDPNVCVIGKTDSWVSCDQLSA